MKSIIYSLRLSMILFGLLMIVLINGCSKEDPNNIDQDEPETILSTKSATIGSQGGSLTLDDGTSITIAKGILSTDYSVTLSKIGNEQIFGSVENRNCYDLSGLPAGIKANLMFPCPPGKEMEFIGVYNYDPVLFEGDQPAFIYDKIEGNIKISNFTLRNSPDPLVQKRRWIVEWGEKQDYGDEIKLIPMPYYMQVGGTCWAADATMLAKAFMPYTSDENEVEIKDFLREMNLGIDAGIDHWSFMKVLYKKFNLLTSGAGAKTEGYFNRSNLLKTIIKKLDENKPIIIWLPNLESAHAVLILGYRTILNSSGYNDYELILHDSKAMDPPNKDEGTMYTYRKWKWFVDGAYPTTFYMIMYPGSPVHSARTLQTVGFPSYPSEMQLKFEKVKNNLKTYYYCKIDHTLPDGYGWVAANNNKQEYITQEAKTLIMNLQLYNADLDNQKDCNVNIKITNLKSNKLTLTKDYPVILGINKKPSMLNISLDTSLWLKNNGDTTIIPYRIECKLSSEFGGTYMDGWNAEFKIKGSAPSGTGNNYITSFNSTPAKMYFYNDYFTADVGVGLSGNQFRVTDEKNLKILKQISFAVPEILNSETKTYDLKINVNNLAINVGPWNPNAKSVYIKKAVVNIDGVDNTLNGSGSWTIPVTFNKNSTTKTLYFDIYMDLIGNNGTPLNQQYAHSFMQMWFTIDN